MNDVQSLIDKGMDMVVVYAPKVLLAIVTLIIGLWLIKMIMKVIAKALDHSKVEESLKTFLDNLIGIILKVLLIVSVASMVGIETTSFIAMIGAAGLAVGLALQGSLANFAGGVIILIFKPFQVGDVIEAQGFSGRVDEIQIFNTILKTLDNRTIILPNGSLASGSICNLSKEPIRRIEFTFGIGYGDDIKKAKDVLMSIMENEPRIQKDPKPMAAVSELGDSSVNFTLHAWVKWEEYWAVFFAIPGAVKMEFDKQGISIPFPQRDVHLYSKN